MTSIPKVLYHETTDAAFKKIKQRGLQPTVGSIVSQIYHGEDDDIIPKGVVFMSDDLAGLGYFCLWQIQHLLNLGSLTDVTLEQLSAHGVILFVDPKADGNDIYQMGPDNVLSVSVNDPDSDASQIEIIDDDEGQEHSVDDLPHSIEPGNWFSLREVTYDRVLKGAELVNFLKVKSTNHAIVDLFKGTAGTKAARVLAKVGRVRKKK